MGFDLGAFAGGVGSGIEQGQDIRKKYQDMAQAQRIKKAQDELLQQQVAAQQPKPAAPAGPPPSVAPQGPTPIPHPLAQGGGPAPQGGPPQGAPPTPVPMPGAQPMPGAGGPAPQGGPPGAQPPQMGGPQGAPRPPMPQPMGGAGGPPGGAPAPGGPAPGGQPSGPQGGGQDNPAAMGQQMVQAIAKQIAQSFPGRKWKPMELLDMVDGDIQLMDSLNPEAKVAAQAQLAGLKAQTAYYQANTRQDTVERGQDLTHGDRTRGQDLQHEDRQDSIGASLKRVMMTTSSAERRQAMGDATRLQTADIAQAGANERSDKVLAARQAAQDAGLDMKEWQTQLEAQLKEEGFDQNYISRLFSAQQGASPTPLAPPKAPVRKPLPAPPSRRNAQAPTAPYPGAKKAPDGNWYVQDPKRPGKYLKVG